jgi:hypothetical protein
MEALMHSRGLDLHVEVIYSVHMAAGVHAASVGVTKHDTRIFVEHFGAAREILRCADIIVRGPAEISPARSLPRIHN